VAVSPDGKTIATGYWDWTVRFWDAATGAPGRVLRGHPLGIYGLTFSPDGTLLASTSGNYGKPDRQGLVRCWDVATTEIKFDLQGHKGAVWSCAFTPDGKTLITGGADQTVRLWDVDTGEERVKLSVPATPVVATQAPQPDIKPASEDLPAPGRRLWWLVGGVLALALLGGLVMLRSAVKTGRRGR
jgi:WD40 repeat protein